MAPAFCFAMRLTLCTHCGAPTANRPSVCDGCLAGRKATQRERNAAYDRLRDQRSVKFYHSAVWRNMRAAKLASIGYLCEDCVAEASAGLRKPEEIAIATDVHHEEELSVTWERRLDWTNLRGLCDCHHKAKRRKR